MIAGFWLAVTANDVAYSSGKESWWCLPFSAKAGDRILFYCPRSVSNARQGVFAEAQVIVAPTHRNANNNYCSGYGICKKGLYGYTEISIVEKFEPRLTAKEFKTDYILGRSAFVRRNFQGTTFPLLLNEYTLIKEKLTKKRLLNK